MKLKKKRKLKDLKNGESSRSRERVQEREDYNRNENQATPQTFNNKQQAIKSVPSKEHFEIEYNFEERNYRMNNNSK